MKFTTLSPFFSYEEAMIVITKKERDKSNKRVRHKKDYWCECCSVKFTDFHEHLLTTKHEDFALNNANYADLD
eukprot:CAMPEP_0168577946 /NCGR_PEP_ID=MMETSP0413-20121227/21060_1 /TAXON_ID=136452 /ORGANISM="Filamoeba nolandi, Strain NC-AS-23-1" /LENGTH=72 /DNA_ID=CAMNT_0008611739 /DNA_START=384 /DNA_END=599 /DNA_ORIENTATION=+